VLNEKPSDPPNRRPQPFDQPLMSAATRRSRARTASRGTPDSRNAQERMRILAELGPGFLHDIRNLLAIMACCTEKARKRSTDLTADALLPLETAIFSAGELTRTFSQLLNTRSGASSLTGKTSANDRLVALQPILKRVVSQATVEYGLQASDLAEISTAPAEFDSAILNLAINARDAFRSVRSPNPVLRITTRSLSVRGQDGKRHRILDVCVRDNGPGMDGQTLADATKPYFTTKGAQGTGLGLYQVRHFCEARGGRLSIRSARGVGTAVHLLLPCIGPERQPLSDMVPIRLPAGTGGQPIIISRTDSE